MRQMTNEETLQAIGRLLNLLMEVVEAVPVASREFEKRLGKDTALLEDMQFIFDRMKGVKAWTPKELQ